MTALAPVTPRATLTIMSQIEGVTEISLYDEKDGPCCVYLSFENKDQAKAAGSVRSILYTGLRKIPVWKPHEFPRERAPHLRGFYIRFLDLKELGGQEVVAVKKILPRFCAESFLENLERKADENLELRKAPLHEVPLRILTAEDMGG